MIDRIALNRRDLIARTALLLGAAALPAEAFAAPAKKAARFLTAPQFALLSAVTDTIMPATDTPGALAAAVPERLDAMLRNWASAETRSDILGALVRIDDAAKAAKGKGFAALSAADRTAVLTAHDAAALKTAPPPPAAAKQNFFTQAVFVADQGYLKLKDMTLNLYYYSEIGSANELEYIHVPGQWQPSITLTPQSRPYLGVGPF
jgi:gluconate 2-dehydrogenase gamma chain